MFFCIQYKISPPEVTALVKHESDKKIKPEDMPEGFGVLYVTEPFFEALRNTIGDKKSNIKEGYNQGFYHGWIGCGIYHIDLDFETENQKAEIKRRLESPNYQPDFKGALCP